MDSFCMPLISHDKTSKLIENEIFAYENSSENHNETFRVFSQSDHEDDEQPPLKKVNNGFNHIKTKVQASSANKFRETMPQKSSVPITPPVSIAETNQISGDLESEGK